MTDLAGELNAKINASSKGSRYKSVRVLILYWEEGDIGFRVEGRDLGRMFQHDFHYDLQEFAIPTLQCYLHLHNCISQTVLALCKESGSHGGHSLLIVHYGGHGDQNDDRSLGEEKRSVWAAQSSGGPTLDWYRIQEDLKHCDIDVLLLLDCCYAAQAGRTHAQRRTRLEVLAASAMGVMTPLPGPRSFTKALGRELTACLKQGGCVAIADLHRRLVAREAYLHATPVYISLLPSSRPVILTPLSTGLALAKIQDPRGTCYQLTFHAEDNGDSARLDEIAAWLGGERPDRITAVTVHNVLQMTNQVDLAYHSLRAGEDSIAASMDDTDMANITSVWQQIQDMIKHYDSSGNTTVNLFGAKSSTKDNGLEILLNHLTQLDSAFTHALKRGIFNSSTTSDLPSVLKVLDSPIAKISDVNEQLQKRRIVCDDLSLIMDEDTTSISDNLAPGVVTERKMYGPYTSPEEVTQMQHRIGLLAAMLRARESRQFLTLRCRGWHHDSIEYCFQLDFDIPETHAIGTTGSQSLHDIITRRTGSSRPTLNQRLKIAWELTKAVENWHAVCWVHQGISSASVKFLESQKRGSLDYDYPILHGFEFSRPSSDPSLGRAADDSTQTIYRHPERQGASPKAHTKTHDIYSLGVVLLEIGLWQTAADILRSYKKSKAQTLQSGDMQRSYTTACKERLAHYAGESYCHAVLKCLSSSFEITLDDRSESRLARAFQESVVDQLYLGVTFTGNTSLLLERT